MTKYKGIAIALCLLGLYTWIVWPEKAKGKQPTISEVKTSELKPAEKTRLPDREASKKVIKEVKHSKDTSSLRKDPGVVLDNTNKHAQQIIESKGYGTFPPVDLNDNNAQKEHLIQALKDPKNNSGAISIVGKREKFDKERYSKDPGYYLNSGEPGRAFDCAHAAEGVSRIERVGNSTFRTEQKKTVSLIAKASSGMPVSFTAFDGGHFQNGLSFITLKADASGVATAEFTPTEGVINQSRVRAASPVTSGTLQWTVFVSLPKNLTSN